MIPYYNIIKFIIFLEFFNLQFEKLNSDFKIKF